jgi:3-phenylpropionate/trans-cinnamate dioxygenase ferredoxin reductase subunit
MKDIGSTNDPIGSQCLPRGSEMQENVIVVGASVAGIGAVSELRNSGYSGAISLIDAQAHLPYDRPPLSKALLTGERHAPALAFHGWDHYERLGVAMRLGQRARAIDPEAIAVELESGERVSGHAIIIATGASARQMRGPDANVRTIRELDDAIRLRAALLEKPRRLALIGGGFIGAEIASSARRLGLEVTIFDVAALPFARVLGEEVANRIRSMHESAGVEMVCGAAVQQVTPHASGGYALHLSEQGSHFVDVVVAGLGAAPNTAWLAGSGLDLDDGVICDEFGRTNHDGVYAAGDVAKWRDTKTGSRRRHEHWTSAREQARIVARTITGARGSTWAEYTPYFWSDLYGKRIQVLGSTEDADTVSLVHDDRVAGAFVAEYRRQGKLVGVAGCNAAAKTMRYLAALA